MAHLADLAASSSTLERKTARFRANEDRFDRCTVEDDELIKRGSFASPVIVTQE